MYRVIEPFNHERKDGSKIALRRQGPKVLRSFCARQISTLPSGTSSLMRDSLKHQMLTTNTKYLHKEKFLVLLRNNTYNPYHEPHGKWWGPRLIRVPAACRTRVSSDRQSPKPVLMDQHNLPLIYLTWLCPCISLGGAE
jgi:hypothetical protein